MQLSELQPGEKPGWDGLYNRLVKAYEAVRTAQPATGHLYVLSYPVPFSNPDKDWGVAFSTLGCSTFSKSNAQLANAMVVRLGDTIARAVQKANSEKGNIHFVDWRPPIVTQQLNGRRQRVAYDPKGLYSPGTLTNWNMNPVILPFSPTGLSPQDSLHPTVRGYAAGSAVLLEQLSRHSW